MNKLNKRGLFSYYVKPAKTTIYKAIFSGSKKLKASSSKSVTIKVRKSKTLIYHGVSTHSWSSFVYPGIEQADMIKSEVDAYEAAAGSTVAWVAFGHEWKTDGHRFPTAVATSIKNRGATPLIYLTLRSVDEGQPDPLYNLAAIIAGDFDSDFIAWADAAKNFGSEIIVSWGWEMNGDWAVWSGTLNGGPLKARHVLEKRIVIS